MKNARVEMGLAPDTLRSMARLVEAHTLSEPAAGLLTFAVATAPDSSTVPDETNALKA